MVRPAYPPRYQKHPALAPLQSVIPHIVCPRAFGGSLARQSEYVSPVDTCQPGAFLVLQQIGQMALCYLGPKYPSRLSHAR